MSTVIQVSNLSKLYRLGEIGTGTISRDLERWYKMRIRGQADPFLKIGETNQRDKKGISDVVYALRDINFEVQQGEALGIIGKNGAGKSTLLKILSRVTSPTTGNIKVKGRVASLLEVGTGFHPELTGRENIYLNGAILGMRKKEITRKLDEIIDFSGVERYIDTPVKRYSSGMYVRLAFAVAAHLESEIMIVDEVLAVGDAEFQKKCLGKIGEVSKGEGRTVLFVSHNMGAIKQLCSKCVLLKNGETESIGPVLDIISKYLINENCNNLEWIRKDLCKSDLYFQKISVLNSRGQLTNTIVTEEDFSIHINIRVLEEIRNATVSIKFSNSEGLPVFTTSLYDCLDETDSLDEGDFLLKANISKNILVPGKYNLVIACFLSRVQLYDIVENYLSITIEDMGIKRKDLDRAGLVIPSYRWDKIKIK